MAECSVWNQPILVLLKELLECGRLHHLCAFLSVDGSQIVHLSVVHTFIVYLWQGVQCFLQSLIFFAQFLVLQLWQLSQVGILWMQGIDADRVVRIRILPGMGNVGIIDR